MDEFCVILYTTTIFRVNNLEKSFRDLVVTICWLVVFHARYCAVYKTILESLFVFTKNVSLRYRPSSPLVLM